MMEIWGKGVMSERGLRNKGVDMRIGFEMGWEGM